jgi:chromosome segregation ATPase
LKLEDVQMQYRQLENKNNELLKKDKNVVSLQENFENELTKHNQALLLNEQKLKEQIAMNKQEIDNLKEERKSLNNFMNEAVVKCSILIKEKNDLEKNIKNKSNQIDNLMNLKTVSNKKILSNSNSYHENSKM